MLDLPDHGYSVAWRGEVAGKPADRNTHLARGRRGITAATDEARLSVRDDGTNGRDITVLDGRERG
jgi:hypothetical protein